MPRNTACSALCRRCFPFRLWYNGHVLAAHWPLSEGIGARVAMDASGNGHNGICMAAGQWGAHWMQVDLPLQLESKEEEDLGLDFTEDRKFDNNSIKLLPFRLKAESVSPPPRHPSGCPWSTARATAPSPGRPTPGVVKQDKSCGGSVDTTKTRSGPRRVGCARARGQ